MFAAARAIGDVALLLFAVGVVTGIAGTLLWLAANDRGIDVRPVGLPPTGRATPPTIRIRPRPYDWNQETS